MGSCLPFLLVSTSIPVTLQSQLPDPAFTELAAKQRPESSLSEPIATQPSRASSPVPLYRRFSKWEAKQRRAHSAPEGTYPGVGDPDLESEPNGRFRKTRSAPSSYEVPIVHEQWVGAKKQQRGKRRVSDPVKPSSPMDIGTSESKANRSSAPPPARSSYSRPSSSASSRHSLDSSVASSASTTPSLQSPALGPETKLAGPPSPGLQTLDEEGLVEEFTEEKPVLPPLRLPSLRLSCSPSSSMSTIGELDISEADRELDPTPSRRPSKRVSFASASPQVITPSSDSILEETTSLRKQKSWSGLFHVNTPPAVALARPVPLTRHGSLQSIKGQAAGKSILRRTSSFSTQLPGDEIAPVLARKPLPRSRSGRTARNTSPPPPMPSVPEKEFVDVDLADFPLVPQSPPSDSELSSPVEKVAVQVSFKNMVVPHPKPTTIVTRPRKPEPAQLMHQRAVRHWSMQASGNWIRRSGVYAQRGNMDRDVPPVPPLPREMLKV